MRRGRGPRKASVSLKSNLVNVDVVSGEESHVVGVARKDIGGMSGSGRCDDDRIDRAVGLDSPQEYPGTSRDRLGRWHNTIDSLNKTVRGGISWAAAN